MPSSSRKAWSKSGPSSVIRQPEALERVPRAEATQPLSPETDHRVSATRRLSVGDGPGRLSADMEIRDAVPVRGGAIVALRHRAPTASVTQTSGTRAELKHCSLTLPKGFRATSRPPKLDLTLRSSSASRAACCLRPSVGLAPRGVAHERLICAATAAAAGSGEPASRARLPRPPTRGGGRARARRRPSVDGAATLPPHRRPRRAARPPLRRRRRRSLRRGAASSAGSAAGSAAVAAASCARTSATACASWPPRSAARRAVAPLNGKINS